MRVAELDQEIEAGDGPPQLRLTPALGKPSVNQLPVARIGGRRCSELTPDERYLILNEFFLSGNFSAISRDRGIDYADLLEMAREAWFVDELRNLGREAQAQLKVRITRMLGTTLGELENRLSHGDRVWRDGRIVTVPIVGRDLAAIATTLFDKKRQIEDSEQGLGTNEGKRLVALAEALRAGGRFEQLEIRDADVLGQISVADTRFEETIQPRTPV